MPKLNMKILLSAILLGGAIYTFFSVKFPQVKDVKFTRVDSFANNKYYGTGIVKISNTNSLQVACKNVSFDLFYKKQLISVGVSQQDFTLKDKDDTDVPVSFIILVDSLLDYANEILEQDSVEVLSEVRGNFTALNFKMEHKQKIQFPTKEITNGLVSAVAKNSFKLKDPKVKSLNFETTQLGVTLLLKNSFPVDLNIEKAEFDVFMRANKKDKISEWGQPNKLIIPSGKDTALSTTLIIDNMRAGSGMLEKMLSKKLDFFIVGTVTVSYNGTNLAVPVELHLGLNPLTGDIIVIES
jgi:LEA14-like dessication related protein